MKYPRLLIGLYVLASVNALAAGPKASFLTQIEIDSAITRFVDIYYPMSQGELMAHLGIRGRNLPGLVIQDGELKNPGPMYYLIHLTDPSILARSYELRLWFDQKSKELSGPAFAEAKNIDYAEIVMREGELVYLVESPRNPYVRLSYGTRKIRKE